VLLPLLRSRCREGLEELIEVGDLGDGDDHVSSLGRVVVEAEAFEKTVPNSGSVGSVIGRELLPRRRSAA
jgi:hypothetical protein